MTTFLNLLLYFFANTFQWTLRYTFIFITNSIIFVAHLLHLTPFISNHLYTHCCSHNCFNESNDSVKFCFFCCTSMAQKKESCLALLKKNWREWQTYFYIFSLIFVSLFVCVWVCVHDYLDYCWYVTEILCHFTKSSRYYYVMDLLHLYLRFRMNSN